MSNTTDTATNGKSEEDQEKEKDVKGGLVKADVQHEEIAILPDNTRLLSTNMLPNNRPITASNLHVAHMLTSAGRRPVMQDTFEIANIDSLPGHRPVAVSKLVISDIGMLPGNRPIASNEIDEDPSTLMGYLD
ncbi:MAG: hypothetical protein HC886_09695 [Leptolyngbyaceae cyanobacterium SM1_1_3]|nr:hypothetical protein [Leptolyngbyaceae cyanobacterium SM1_1_3]NJN04313.1 hypothetical protein [Leptolyngbyaceae cyanobacterium RM1_1_2]NJO10419.1 hypothetical protein [Leptolyngbyaceae cyanobacterium SL_1_1]